MVSLWINGTEYANNFSTNINRAAYLTDVGWGAADVGQNPLANWNLVSLTIPEPSLVSVFLLGSGALFYLRRKYLR